MAVALVAACGGTGGNAGGTGGTHVGGSSGSGASGASSTSGSQASVASSSSGSGGSTVSSSSGSGASVGSSSSSGTSSSSSGDTDGGARDLSPDRNLFFGASRCAQADVLLCEGFESGTLDTHTWTVAGTAPVIDTVHAARGSRALHITKAGSGASYISETKTFPAENNTYFGRVFAYFNQLPAAPGMTYAHWTFVAGSGTGIPGEIRLSGQLSNTVNHFGVGTDSGTFDGGTGDWTSSDEDPMKSPLPVPTGSWVCIEWMHKGDTNETRFYWDAVEHPSLYTSATIHGGNTNPYVLPQFERVWLGWQEYQASTEPFEMWIDEIAIDKARIGCVL